MVRRLTRFKTKNLLYFILYFAFWFQLLNNVFGVPTIFRYLVDACIIILGISSLKNLKKQKAEGVSFIWGWFILYVIYLIFSYIVNYQSGAYLFFGLKNNLRFILFFFLCIRFFNEEDVKKIFGTIDKLFYINFAVIILEYLVFGLRGDYLGGIFGTTQGCNGYLNIYMVVYIIITAVNYIETRKEKITILLVKFAIIASISALCELKILFFELVIIVFLSILCGGFSVKKIMIIGISLVAMYIAYIYMIGIFEYSVNVFTREGFLNYTIRSGYTLRAYEFNRLNFITVANDFFLRTPIQRLMGLGVGNCDYSNIQIFNSPFATQYSNTHYAWFMSSFTYLEQGLIGLIWYLLLFVLIIISVLRIKKKTSSIYSRISAIMAFMCIIIVFYNQSMREDMAFLTYYTMSIPFIMKKRNRFIT